MDEHILPDIEENRQLTEVVEQDSESRRSGVIALPVNSLTTFNVDSLDDLKPILCVENGFVTSGSDSSIKPTHIVLRSAQDSQSSEMKPTHIVIQQATDLQSTTSEPTHIVIQDPQTGSGETTHILIQQTQQENSTTSRGSVSWGEAVNNPVLHIRCKTTTAELHKDKFGSGGHGRCIKKGKEWYTPIEFEAACGRGCSKDWKRSIRFGGHSIQALINEGVLTPHANSCTCAVCSEDVSSSCGPIRYFVPYKRRRRDNASDSDEKKTKVPRESSADESDSEVQYNSKKEEAWQKLTNGLDTDSILEDGDPLLTSTLDDSQNLIKKIDEMSEKMSKWYGNCKKFLQEMRGIASQVYEAQEKLQQQSATTTTTALNGTVGLQLKNSVGNENETTYKKCANCDREAYAECSLCHQTPYCSTFCQKKDWEVHQMDCVRTMSVPCQVMSENQSIMLIVQNPHD